MALRIRENWDGYNAVADMAIGGAGFGMWDSVGGIVTFSTSTPYGIGQSITMSQVGATAGPAKDGFANASTVLISVLRGQNGGLAAASNREAIILRDGGTTQVALSFQGDGTIKVMTTESGSVLATFSSAYSANSWREFQFRVVIHNTAGEVHLRVDGDTTDTFSATGLNTRNGTSNNQVNGIRWGSGTTAQNVSILKHIAMWDTVDDGTVWKDWIPGLRAYAASAVADSSVQFAQQNGGSTTFGSTTVAANLAVSANQILLIPVTPNCGGALGNLSVTLNAGITGHMNAALYDTDGSTTSFGTVGNLLNTCSALTNPSSTPTFVWTATPNVQNGHKYLIAIWSDAAFTIKAAGSTGGVSAPLTYTGTFPSSLASSGQASTGTVGNASATITVPNAGLVNDYAEDGATTYVSSATQGQVDQYTISGVPTNFGTISSIAGVDATWMLQKTDLGTRQANLRMISNGAIKDFTTESPPFGTYQFRRYAQDTDPFTSNPWLVANLNSVTFGPRVTT